MGTTAESLELRFRLYLTLINSGRGVKGGLDRWKYHLLGDCPPWVSKIQTDPRYPDRCVPTVKHEVFQDRGLRSIYLLNGYEMLDNIGNVLLIHWLQESDVLCWCNCCIVISRELNTVNAQRTGGGILLVSPVHQMYERMKLTIWISVLRYIFHHRLEECWD